MTQAEAREAVRNAHVNLQELNQKSFLINQSLSSMSAVVAAINIKKVKEVRVSLTCSLSAAVAPTSALPSGGAKHESHDFVPIPLHSSCKACTPRRLRASRRRPPPHSGACPSVSTWPRSSPGYVRNVHQAIDGFWQASWPSLSTSKTILTYMHTAHRSRGGSRHGADSAGRGLQGDDGRDNMFGARRYTRVSSRSARPSHDSRCPTGTAQ